MLQDEIRKRLPLAYARYPKSKLTAIRLFCIECMGGSTKDAIECATTRCFLHPHRGASWTPEGRAKRAAMDAARRTSKNDGNEPAEAPSDASEG